MDIVLLPKENYPFKRVRLSQLFMEYFAKGNDHVYWIAYGNRNDLIIINNNYINTIKPTNIQGNLGIIISRLLIYKKYSKLKLSLQKNKNIQLVLSNDGLLEGFIGLILARKYKKKYGFYLSSLFFNMELNEFKNMPSLISLLKTIESYIKYPLYYSLIKRADIFHPISESMGNYYARKGYPKNKMYPLPLCPAKEMIDKPIRSKIIHHNTLKIIYIGQITPVRNIEFLIDIINCIKNDINIELKIIGKIYRNKYKKKLNDKILELGLEKNIKIINEVSFDEIISYIDDSDLGISILPPILAYRVSSPTKVVEYLSRGIPVIANREIDDQRMIIEESGGGLTTKYELFEIAKAIMELNNNIEMCRDMGNKGRQYILNNRNYENLVFNLKKYYIRIMNY